MTTSKKSDPVYFDQQSGKPVRLEPNPATTNFTNRLIKVKGSQKADYLQVKDRLQMLREMWPEATVTTEVIKHEVSADRAKTFATVRAEVHLPNGAVGTGHKTEHQSHFEDYVEKAETGAVGRALSSAGVGLQYSAVDYSYEEGSPKEFTGVDSPVQVPEPAVVTPKTVLDTKKYAALSKDELRSKLKDQTDRLGVDKMAAYREKEFGKGLSSQLTNAQLAQMLSWAEQE